MRADDHERIAIQANASHMAIVAGRKSLIWVSQEFPPRLIREIVRFLGQEYRRGKSS